VLDDPDHLRGDLHVSHSRTEAGFRGALVDRSGRWTWQCTCRPEHASVQEARDCGRQELSRRRGRGSQPFSVR
jgi:hypothetical protein